MKFIKKFLKWTGIFLLVVLVIIGSYVAIRQNVKFDAPTPDVHASTDSTLIAEGRYLFYGPAHCIDCHGNKKEFVGLTSVESLPPSGGTEFILPIGTMYTPNITSDKETGIGKLTDGQIARTLRYGVGSDNRALLDFMPFHNMSDHDLSAIISYLRTIAPVKKSIPPMTYNFIGKIVKAFLLKPVGPDGVVPKEITKAPTVEYGKYLSNSVANCRGCHTNRDMMTGKFIGEDFAGGLKIEDETKAGQSFVTRNLTPDTSFGQIRDWSLETFIMRFHNGRVFPGSPMPWEAFKNLNDTDLTAIYNYLQTLKPVHNDPGPVIVSIEE